VAWHRSSSKSFASSAKVSLASPGDAGVTGAGARFDDRAMTAAKYNPVAAELLPFGVVTAYLIALPARVFKHYET
jgi:hypothetical protein